jgi:uncharacterized FlaG/YvyC family protein
MYAKFLFSLPRCCRYGEREPPYLFEVPHDRRLWRLPGKGCAGPAFASFIAVQSLVDASAGDNGARVPEWLWPTMTAISSESKSVSAATPVAAARGKLAVDPKILRPALAPTNAAKAVKPASTPATPEDLDKLVQSIRNKVAAFAPELQFTIDAESGESVVRVTDAATKDVVWQFPPKLAFELAKEIDAFRKGMLLNQKA